MPRAANTNPAPPGAGKPKATRRFDRLGGLRSKENAMAVHVHRHSSAPSPWPLDGMATLEAGPLSSTGVMLDELLGQDVAAARLSLTIIDILARLAADDALLTPEAVLTFDLDGLSDDALIRLRQSLVESGSRRMRLAAALGAVLGLRAVDATA